jgi:hypothetical protein
MKKVDKLIWHVHTRNAVVARFCWSTLLDNRIILGGNGNILLVYDGKFSVLLQYILL